MRLSALVYMAFKKCSFDLQNKFGRGVEFKTKVIGNIFKLGPRSGHRTIT